MATPARAAAESRANKAFGSSPGDLKGVGRAGRVPSNTPVESYTEHGLPWRFTHSVPGQKPWQIAPKYTNYREVA